MSKNKTVEVETWDEFLWPDWVPADVRNQLRDFWNERWERSPAEWKRSCSTPWNAHPPLGSVVEATGFVGKDIYTGRWVPMWNNIARLVMDDGTVICTGTMHIERIVRAGP